MIDDEDYNNVCDDEYNRLLVCQKGENDRNPFFDDITHYTGFYIAPGSETLVSIQVI